MINPSFHQPVPMYAPLPQQESEDTEESGATSRKSSRASGADKQFAVTFFVSESDKTKLVDILHKAKSVISKKVGFGVALYD